MEWEAGLRYQQTDVEINDQTVDPADARAENDYGVFLPSAHLRWNLDDSNRVTASVARTMRRPGFDQISPALLLAELGDNDLLGNPDLEPETAWGLDLGWERRLGSRGVIGVNAFYRDITNLIEIANTGVEGDEGPGTFVLQPRNTGDGEVWGIELDLSTPLTAFGLDNTGVFFNYSWLDSEIEDVFGTRKFNDQSDYVFNVGFIQQLPEPGGVVRRQLPQAGRRLRPDRRRGGRHLLRRRPGSVRREALRRPVDPAPDRLEPARQLEGRGVRQVHHHRRPGQPRLRRVRGRDRVGGAGLPVRRALFVLS